MTEAGAGAAGAGLTSPLRMICATCCFSIFTALSCPLIVGLSGASACTLPLAVSWRLPSPLIGSDGQPQACRIFSGTPRPLKLRLTWRCGSWDTAAAVSYTHLPQVAGVQGGTQTGSELGVVVSAEGNTLTITL